MNKAEADFTNVFARWTKAFRKRLAVTQVQLADLLGASVESVSRWELGQTQPYAVNMLRLMALATDQERAALVDKASDTLNDVMRLDDGGACCEKCGLPMRVRDFTTRDWPAPPKIQQDDDPYAVRVCPRCQGRE